MAPRLTVIEGGKPCTEHDAPARVERSCETSFGRGARARVHAFRCSFADHMARYFAASGLTAAEIAVVYGVSVRTAENWLAGVVVPRGDVVALIALRDPAGFQAVFGRAAA